MKRLTFLLALIAISTFSFAAGCDDSSTNGGNETGKVNDPHGHDHDDDSHSHVAPHGGDLVDLGRDHMYHAELVDDHKTDTATVYLLDAELKAMSHDQPSITLILTAGDKTETFELAANKDGEPGEYNSKEPALFKFLDASDLKGKIRTTINNKPFNGTFDHIGHDHDGHDHGDGNGHDEEGHSAEPKK